MNKKDYKEIAEILKSSYIGYKLPLPMKRDLSNKLADYFEREQVYTCEICGAVLSGETKQKHQEHTEHEDYRANFNREQFLKDCGVEE